jgi:hypothetical protein
MTVRTVNLAPRWMALGTIAIDEVKRGMTSSSKEFIINLIEDACLSLDKFNDEIKEQEDDATNN